MFFVKDSERTIRIHPSFMGPNIQQYLMAEVVKDTEGTTVDNYYVICILDDYQFSEGRALPGSGHVEYVATYRALCWKPFKNEVVCPAEQ
jgi:DNA-directed RNA polymerase II subunit RPB7